MEESSGLPGREPAGTEHVELLAFGDEAVPDVFVEAVGEADRVEHGVAVSDLEQEGNHAEIQIEVGDERAVVGRGGPRQQPVLRTTVEVPSPGLAGRKL